MSDINQFKIELIVSDSKGQVQVTDRTIYNQNILKKIPSADFGNLNSNDIYEFTYIGSNKYQFVLKPIIAPYYNFYVDTFDVKIIRNYQAIGGINPSPMDFELNNETNYNVKLTIVSPPNYSTIIDANICEMSRNLFTIKEPTNYKDPSPQEGFTTRQIPTICGNDMYVDVIGRNKVVPINLFSLAI